MLFKISITMNANFLDAQASQEPTMSVSLCVCLCVCLSVPISLYITITQPNEAILV